MVVLGYYVIRIILVLWPMAFMVIWPMGDMAYGLWVIWPCVMGYMASWPMGYMVMGYWVL
jgi:hypothetical protein